MTISAPLVGMRYHPGAAEKLESLTFGDPLHLAPDPSNPFDENAIQVFSLDGVMLGYIAREFAADWAPAFAAEGVPEARLTFSSSGHPRVEINWEESEPADDKENYEEARSDLAREEAAFELEGSND